MSNFNSVWYQKVLSPGKAEYQQYSTDSGYEKTFHGQSGWFLHRLSNCTSSWPWRDSDGQERSRVCGMKVENQVFLFRETEDNRFDRSSLDLC